MFHKTNLNIEKFFESSNEKPLVKEKKFVSYKTEKEKTSDNYFIDDLGRLKYKINKGKIFDFSF